MGWRLRHKNSPTIKAYGVVPALVRVLKCAAKIISAAEELFGRLHIISKYNINSNSLHEWDPRASLGPLYSHSVHTYASKFKMFLNISRD